MKLIKGKFVANKENNDYAAGYGQGQPKYIDKRKDLVFKNISKSDFKIVTKHIFFE
jgi:hypothetical protein